MPQPSIPARLAMSPGEQLLALTTLIATGMVGTWWGTVMLLGRLGDGRWPRLDSSVFGRALSHTAVHPGDPAGGLPQSMLVHRPAPLVFYLVAVGLVVAAGLALGLIVAVWRGALAAPGVLLTSLPRSVGHAHQRGARESRRQVRDGAQWARAEDLRDLVVRSPRPGRLTLGTWERRLLAGQERHSVIVVGPPGSMKTTGMAVPAILEWEGPVLATSVKSDLLRDTLARREQLGDVFVFDPTESTGIAGSSWSPLSSCDTWYGAQRTASWLCQAVHSTGRSGGGDFDFWYAAAAKLLGPVLFAARAGRHSMADVVRWIDTQESDQILDALEIAGDDGARNAWKANELRDSRQRSSIYTTTETVLAAYADPRVMAASRSGELTAAGLLDGGCHTAYVCAPADEQTRLRPLLSTLIYDVVSHAYAASTRSGRPLDPPLLIVLDELANIAPLRDLDTLASTARGQGIQLVSIVQDIAQLTSRYGPERSRTIVNNHHAKLILSGISDTETLELVSKLVGETALTQRSSSIGTDRGTSVSQSTTYRRLAPADVVRGQAPGEATLIYGHLPAAKLRLRPWFRDRDLQSLAAASGLNACHNHVLDLAAGGLARRRPHRSDRMTPGTGAG